jgi:2-aminoadipate transaminase
VLEDHLRAGLRPRLVYVVPNFHNPTGATLSAGRARDLARLADHYGLLVVEDDPYGEIRFSGTAPPPLATLTDRAVSIGTISKVLFPGLRVGWVVAPPALAASLVLVKQAVDLHTSTLAQGIAFGLLTRPGFLAGHVTDLRDHYRNQARVLGAALGAEFGSDLAVVHPEGGLFVWGEVRRPGIDTEALLARAIDHGVAYVPGSAFSVTRPQRASLRLCYATAAPADLVEGARRLADVLLDGGAGHPGGPTPSTERRSVATTTVSRPGPTSE